MNTDPLISLIITSALVLVVAWLLFVQLLAMPTLFTISAVIVAVVALIRLTQRL